MMTDNCRLLITSGNGPTECRIALRFVLQTMQREADVAGIDLSITTSSGGDKHGPASAIAVLYGPSAVLLAKRWLGTVQWVATSPLRPQHKRRNWFVGVKLLDTVAQTSITIVAADLKFEAFRAGGAGGQHQNTTDSAVRATHTPTGLAVVVRDQRSQHQNRKIAIERIAELLNLRQQLSTADDDARQHKSHQELERGNPVRVFKGLEFSEQ
jgi:peptide chain release factor